MARRLCLECYEERDSEYCPECGGETEPLVECGNCGAPNIEGATHCHDCDEPLEDE